MAPPLIDDDEDELTKALLPLAPRPVTAVPPLIARPAGQSATIMPSLSPKTVNPEPPLPALSPVSDPAIPSMDLPKLDWKEQASDAGNALDPHGWRKALGLGLSALAGAGAGYRNPAEAAPTAERTADAFLHSGDQQIAQYRADQADKAQQAQSAENAQVENTLKGAQTAEAQARTKQIGQPSTPEEDWRPVTGTNWEINSKNGQTRQMAGVPAATKAPNDQEQAISDYLASKGLADTPANRDKARDALKTRDRTPRQPTLYEEYRQEHPGATIEQFWAAQKGATGDAGLQDKLAAAEAQKNDKLAALESSKTNNPKQLPQAKQDIQDAYEQELRRLGQTVTHYAYAPPPNATGMAPGSDGHMHYHDARGADLGVAVGR